MHPPPVLGLSAKPISLARKGTRLQVNTHTKQGVRRRVAKMHSLQAYSGSGDRSCSVGARVLGLSKAEQRGARQQRAGSRWPHRTRPTYDKERQREPRRIDDGQQQ